MTLAVLLPQSALAQDCVAPVPLDIVGPEPLTAPAPPDPALRPVLPDCLAGLSSPEQENCPRDVIAAYARDVAAYSDALQAYVLAADRHANTANRRANAAIAAARDARDHAEAAYAFAECEADAILRSEVARGE
ncbi:hypothetical protein [Ovoidimarina sediminis]|uniref:hypothetical protein n=1 Tax=Ovoidimarina sediminis TaxID=3079856 RepID=UPI00290843CE|nr:hypothetical protein [Rhodophyticola sp. MJ-SS7]MDU8944559.1 hypothetical protein [Rhodophyticola sp. MJ-SS7]